MKNRGFDGWRWWRMIQMMNMTKIVYGAEGIDTQFARELHSRLPHLEYDRLYQLIIELHLECYGR